MSEYLAPPAASPRLLTESAGRSGVRRSWAELISSLHGGIAVLDTGSRVERVSHGFLVTTGLDAHEMIGRDIREVFPKLGVLNPRSLLERVARGDLVGIGQQVRDRDGAIRWVRVTVVACPGLADDDRAVVFVQNTTATSRAVTLRRQATLRLTDVEDEELERLRRELHDGPIQLLTALSWRLSMLDDSEAVERLRDEIGIVTSELRIVLTEFAPPEDLTAGATLQRWIAPFMVGAPLELAIEDHLTTPPNRALTQAAFVFVYELVRATRHLPLERSQSVSLDDERGGYRILLTTTTSGDGSMMRGPAAAQFRAMVEYARSLGGTLETELTDEAIRTFSLWLPATGEAVVDDHDEVADDVARVEPRPECVAAPDAAPLPELIDAHWDRLIRAAPMPVVEFDRTLRWTFANRAYEQMEGATERELQGGDALTERFTREEVAGLLPHLARLRTGETLRLDWLRANADGQDRFVRFCATPRVGEAGEFLGALTVLEDLSDLHFLEYLQSSALSDLAQSRNRARQASITRLRGPLGLLRNVATGVREVEAALSRDEPFRAIREGIEDAIGRISRAVDLLEIPDLTEIDLGHAIRASLTSMLTDVEFDFIDRVTELLDGDRAEALFRIAREAAVNAVIHGGARRIVVTLRDHRGGVAMDVTNDGVSVDPAALDTAADHLGVRLMVERARAQSGTCTIRPLADGGTLVKVWLPPPIERKVVRADERTRSVTPHA